MGAKTSLKSPFAGHCVAVSGPRHPPVGNGVHLAGQVLTEVGFLVLVEDLDPAVHAHLTPEKRPALRVRTMFLGHVVTLPPNGPMQVPLTRVQVRGQDLH